MFPFINHTVAFTSQLLSWFENTVKGSEYTGDPLAAYAGDTVTYTYDIYNPGTTTLSQLAFTSTEVGYRI